MSYKTLVPLPPPTAMNSGLTAAKVATLESCFGPFPNLGSDCGSVHNVKVSHLLETRDVGPFRATGIKPALDDLQAIFAEVKSAHPDLYAVIGTAGMLCYRCVRGYPGQPSNHAAGTAIDITIDKYLIPLGATKWPTGMQILYGYFHRHGWFDGAGYHNGRPDGMHKEVSDEKLKQWKAAGKI